MAPIVRSTTTIKLPSISLKKYARPRMTTWPKIDKFEELSPFIHRQQSLVGPTIRRMDLLIIQGAHSFVTPLFTPRYSIGTQESTISSGTGRFTCRRTTPELEAYGTFGRMKKIKVRSIRTLSPNESQTGFLHSAAIRGT